MATAHERLTTRLGACLAPFALVLGGCAGTHSITEEPYVPAAYHLPAPKPVDGAILHLGQQIALFEDVTARRAGDILTVMLVEQTSGTQNADSSLNQSTGANVGVPLFGGSQRPNLEVDLSSGYNFSGENASTQSNRLSGSITVTVTQVLPGGNLVVQGEKWIQINQSKEFVRLQGIVRPRDIDSRNTVLSTEVADARISYSGAGVGEDANSVGLAARFLFSEIWPF